MERIFVSDGDIHGGDWRHHMRTLEQVRAYMYAGWQYTGWGTAPGPTLGTGFYFTRVEDSSGPGFGAQVLVDRLRSGLHFARVLEEEAADA